VKHSLPAKFSDLADVSKQPKGGWKKYSYVSANVKERQKKDFANSEIRYGITHYEHSTGFKDAITFLKHACAIGQVADAQGRDNLTKLFRRASRKIR
jgi:hypothetical protein